MYPLHGSCSQPTTAAAAVTVTAGHLQKDTIQHHPILMLGFFLWASLHWLLRTNSVSGKVLLGIEIPGMFFYIIFLTASAEVNIIFKTRHTFREFLFKEEIFQGLWLELRYNFRSKKQQGENRQ